MDPTLLQQIITGIHVRSNVAPDIDLIDPFNASPAPNAVLSAARPQISFDVLGSSTPIVIAPYGAPGPYGGAAAAGTGLLSIALLALAAYGGLRLVAR